MSSHFQRKIVKRRITWKVFAILQSVPVISESQLMEIFFGVIVLQVLKMHEERTD